MKDNQLLGFVLSILGAFMGIVGSIIVFILTYEPYIFAELNNLGEEGCDVIIRDFLPTILDICLIVGILFTLSAYSFFTGKKWSISLAVVGNTICLLGGFWPTIPAMQMGMMPLWGAIFVPNLMIFFLLTHYVDKIPWITVLFALLTGIAYVMSFLNGIASTNRMALYPALDVSDWELILTLSEPTVTIHAIFKGLQRVNWIAAIGWGIVTIGISHRPKED
ncbi:MAG: hypothetical protein ACFE9L_18250 [Candidatus Hodarchaeota archaeon]